MMLNSLLASAIKIKSRKCYTIYLHVDISSLQIKGLMLALDLLPRPHQRLSDFAKNSL